MSVKASCDGKIKHKTQASVDHYMTNINTDKSAQPYTCKYCGFIHIGTLKETQKIKTKTRKKVVKPPKEEKIKIKRMKL